MTRVIALAILAFALAGCGVQTEPDRHYDADNRVMCYTYRGDISCVRTD